MLTVAELLQGLDFRVLAGESALDAPLRWVHISELSDPTPWLSGGELLLTTGMQLDSAKRQREFIRRLADHQLAAVGFGTGFSHPEVPKSLVAAAEERDLPLFEVPYEVPFIAITEKAFTRLVNEQYAVLRRAIAAHDRLEQIVLSQRGLGAVVAAISALIGGAALVFDARGEALAQRTFRRPLEDETLAALREQLRQRASGEPRGFVPSHEELAGRALALPVPATGRPASSAAPQAWLVAVKDSSGLSEFDRLALHQAVTIVALELLRGRVAQDTERRLAGDILRDVLDGTLSGDELARRLEPFGLGEHVAAIVVAPAAAGPGHAADALETAEQALASAVREAGLASLVATATLDTPGGGTLVGALVPGLTDDELLATGERVRRGAGVQAGAPLATAVGRGVPAGQARRALHEARCALDARALSGENGSAVARLATYRDLGSFQLLLSLQDDESLRLFCDSILGPIENGEGAYGDELMRSLEAFIEENGQWERAAGRLFCHRHTLRYRIRKVEELTGRDLSNARDRIEFWLALRGRELVA